MADAFPGAGPTGDVGKVAFAPTRQDVCLAELEEISRLYYELIYQVSNKYPDESRHDTALRYLREREAWNMVNTGAKSAVGNK